MKDRIPIALQPIAIRPIDKSVVTYIIVVFWQIPKLLLIESRQLPTKCKQLCR